MANKNGGETISFTYIAGREHAAVSTTGQPLQ